MGLAPLVVQEIFEAVRVLNQQGVSFLVAEQNARIALSYADHAYVLETGRVVASGSAQQLSANADMHDFYLGASGEHRTSFIDERLRRKA